jgi:[ribosomal protein S5]-alanine N-acetyltransferase
MNVPNTYLSEHRTERLTIRPLDATYIEPWTRFLENPESTRYLIASDPVPAENARIWIERQLERYRNGTFGVMALHDTNGSFVGQCGLISQQVEGEPLLEIGYHLYPEYRGMGYASEAATYFREYAFANRIAPFVVSIILKGNEASMAVARRNGMELWKEANWRGLDVMIFRTNNQLHG